MSNSLSDWSLAPSFSTKARLQAGQGLSAVWVHFLDEPRGARVANCGVASLGHPPASSPHPNTTTLYSHQRLPSPSQYPPPPPSVSPRCPHIYAGKRIAGEMWRPASRRGGGGGVRADDALEPTAEACVRAVGAKREPLDSLNTKKCLAWRVGNTALRGWLRGSEARRKVAQGVGWLRFCRNSIAPCNKSLSAAKCDVITLSPLLVSRRLAGGRDAP